MAFRTKKISQMDPKGSNLASTDLLEISQLVSGSYVTKSITGAQIAASAPAAAWGTITGTLSSQTDLNTALSGKVPTSRTLTINGTTQDLSADRTFTVSTGITIGTTAITSGTVGRVLFQGAGNVVQQSSSLAYDDTAKTFTLSANQNASTSITISNTTSGTSAQSALLLNGTAGIYKYSGSTSPYKIFLANDFGHYNGNIGDISILNDVAGAKIKFATGAVSTAQMTLFSTGNFAINTTTDAGFKLDVNGTARVKGTGTGSGTSAFTIINSGNTENFRVADDGVTFIRSGTALRTGTAGSDYYLDLGNIVARNGNGTAASTMSIGKSTVSVASSIFELVSTTKGFLPPRMDTTQKNAIATPATGLMVYDTTLNKLCVRTASAWETITSL